MTDRIDGTGYYVQTAGRKAMVDGVLAKPQLQQLPSRNHPILPLRQPRHGSIGVYASSPQPASIAG